MNKDVNIYFKVEGLDGYITNLDDLKSALNDVDSTTKKASDSTEMLNESFEGSADKVRGFKGAVDVLGGSVEVLVGGLGLLGAQPAWLESMEDGAMNAIAFADGISRLADGVNDVRDFMKSYTTATKANTVAIKAQDTATKAAAVSTRTLSTVLKGAGIGLVVAGLAALVANWEKVLGFLGFANKEYDDTLRKQIENLEVQNEIANIQGQSAVDNAKAEEELARLRAKEAVNYLSYLESVGAAEEEIAQAQQDATEKLQRYEVALAAATQAVKEFNDEQIRLQEEAVANDPNIYGTPAYYEAVAEALRDSVDYEQYSANRRLELARILAEKLREQANSAYEQEKQDLDRRLEEGLITEETYNALIIAARSRRDDALGQASAELARNELKIQQETWDRRFNLAQMGVQTLIKLNDATAGASEAEQRKAFERNKKLQIGLATIQTAQAVTAALTAGGNPVKLATGAQFVEAGIVAATGLAQILAIKNQQFESASTPPPVNANAGTSINYTFGQQAGQTITTGQTSTGQQIAPVQTYVLASDVTNAQQAQQQIQNLSRL